MTDKIRTLQGRVVSDKMEKSLSLLSIVWLNTHYMVKVYPSYDQTACT